MLIHGIPNFMVRNPKKLRSLVGCESWLTAAIPMENPYCSCKLTRVRYADHGDVLAVAIKVKSNEASWAMVAFHTYKDAANCVDAGLVAPKFKKFKGASMRVLAPHNMDCPRTRWP